MITKKQQSLLFAISYLGWFGCVFSGKFELGLLSYLIPASFLFVYSRVEKLSLSLALVFGIVSVVGLAFDALAMAKGWIVMLQPHSGWVPPHWLISLWLLFAFSIPMYNSWLKQKYLLSAVLGFFLGPVTYFSGVKLGVLQMEKTEAFLFYAIFWGFFFPACFALYEAHLKANNTVPKL